MSDPGSGSPRPEPGSHPQPSGPERVRVRVKVRKRRKPKRWYKRKGVRIGLGVAAAVLLILLLDTLWAGITVERSLRGARDSLSQGADALASGDLEAARTRFGLAGDQARQAASAMDHPAFLLARALPVIGDDADAVSTFGRAAVSTADAGGALVDAAQAAGWTGAGASVIQPGGRINVDGIAAAAPKLRRADDLLAGARRELGTVDTSSLLGPVRDATVAGRTELDRVAGITDRAATLAGFMPGVLGRDEARTYLVIVMTLSDPRGSGGYPGAFGLLKVKGGKLDLEDLRPTSDIQPVAPVKSQAKAQERYIRFGALTNFIATTYSPNFPDTGALISDMWKAGGRPAIDGVIGVDSKWMSYLLKGIGPVTVPGQPEPLTSENLTDVIDRQSLLTDSKQASDRIQARLGTALFGALLDGGGDPKLVAEAMSQAVAERHFQVWMARPPEEATIEDLGAAGTFDPGANPLAIAWDGTISARTGYFAQKSVDYTATINPDGSADVTMDITVSNLAPPGPPSILLGDGRWMPVGFYSVNASIYLPEGAQNITSEPGTGGGFLNLVEDEFGHPVVFQSFSIPSGGSSTARVTYTIPPPKVQGAFSLDISPLPALRPDAITVKIEIPQGSEPTTSTTGASISGSTITWSMAPVTPATVSVSYGG